MPGAPFSIRVHIAPGANPAADAGTWVWRDISDDVRHPGPDGGQPITVTAGRQDEGARVDPSTMNLSLDNTLGHYSTHNANGQWYGLLRRNTPIRLGVDVGADTFTRTTSNGWGTSDSGQAWVPVGFAAPWSTDGSTALGTLTAPNTADAILLSGADGADFDGYFTCHAPVVATGGPFIFSAMARYVDPSNFYLFRCELSTAGTLSAKIYRTATSGSATLATAEPLAFTYAAGERIRVRFQGDGPALRLKIWKEADPEPDAWTVTGSDTVLTGTQLGIHLWRFSTNTNPGSVALHVDDVAVQSVEFTGTVTQWPVRWDITGTHCWAPIQAAGVLRRLLQGSPQLRSPLYRQLSSYNPAGYWPLEDGSDATSAANAVTGGSPAATRDVSYASDPTLPGADPVLTFSSDTSRLVARARITPTASGLAVMMLFKLPALPPADTILYQWSATGRVVLWRIMAGPTTFHIYGWDTNDVLVVDNLSSIYVVDPTEWTAIQLETEVVGPDTTWALIWHQVGLTTYWATTGSYTSTAPSAPHQVSIPPSTHLVGASFAHLWAGANTLPFVADSFSLVSNGYVGELAADRIQRICDEENVPVVVEAAVSEPLGPQRTGTLLDVLRSAADADMGVLYERGTGLGYQPRAVRYSKPVLLALSVAAGQLRDPPDPVTDDQRVRNDWTVTRDNGSSARAYDQDHIDAEGRYADSATINVATDDVLADHAGWRTHLGTWPDLRWPGLTIDFARNPDLLPAWRSKGYGPRITVDTGLQQVTGADPDVIVDGWTQTLSQHEWTAALNCSTARAWDAPTLDDTARADTDGSELDTDTTDTATTLLVAVTAGPLWTTDPADCPFSVTAGGEQITVTAVAGASSPQTFTVTRSVNAVTKNHPAGTDVRLSTPSYAAL